MQQHFRPPGAKFCVRSHSHSFSSHSFSHLAMLLSGQILLIIRKGSSGRARIYEKLRKVVVFSLIVCNIFCLSHCSNSLAVHSFVSTSGKILCAKIGLMIGFLETWTNLRHDLMIRSDFYYFPLNGAFSMCIQQEARIKILEFFSDRSITVSGVVTYDEVIIDTLNYSNDANSLTCSILSSSLVSASPGIAHIY